jgi:hypothetical protein
MAKHTLQLGKTTTDQSKLGFRDAFHTTAVLVSLTGRQVRPGDRVVFADDKFRTVTAATDSTYHGVVDPHLTEAPKTGSDTLCWVFLKPGLAAAVTHTFDINLAGTGEIDEAELLSRLSEKDSLLDKIRQAMGDIDACCPDEEAIWRVERLLRGEDPDEYDDNDEDEDEE